MTKFSRILNQGIHRAGTALHSAESPCTLTLQVKNPWAIGRKVADVEHCLACGLKIIGIGTSKPNAHTDAHAETALEAGALVRISVPPSRLELVMAYIGPCIA